MLDGADRYRASFLTAWNVRGRDPVPIHTALAGFVGIGIPVAGGSGNVIPTTA